MVHARRQRAPDGARHLEGPGVDAQQPGAGGERGADGLPVLESCCSVGVPSTLEYSFIRSGGRGTAARDVSLGRRADKACRVVGGRLVSLASRRAR